MQTLGNYLGLGPSEETSESMFQVATRTFNLLYCFPFMLLIGLISLASVLKSGPVRLFGARGANRDRDRLVLFQNLKITELNRW
jgi:hypothetical protein